jgi:hypothetical protein
VQRLFDVSEPAFDLSNDLNKIVDIEARAR